MISQQTNKGLDKDMGKRSSIRRHAERAVPEEAAEILARGAVAHVGFVQDRQPFVLPFSYYYDATEPDRLYLHGSVASRALLHAASGEPLCVTVTLLDGLVYSRTAIFHGMNYRSAVCFGRARMLETEERKRTVLEKMIARYFQDRAPGRDYEPPPREHLQATAIVEIQIEEMSAKAARRKPQSPGSGVVQFDCRELPAPRQTDSDMAQDGQPRH